MSTTIDALRDDSLLVNRQHMACEVDAGICERARIGLIVLASDHTVEHEFRKIFTMAGVGLYQSRIRNEPHITPETLAAMEDRLTECTDVILPGMPIDVVAFGCTSASMVIGEEKVFERIRAARPETACTTPITAAFAAFRALDVRRIAILTPYRDDINRYMRDYITQRGFQVPVMGSFNVENDNRAARISPDSIRAAALELGRHPEVDALFVSCTSLRLAEVAAEIERELGKPVTSSNHAMAWHCLRLAGIDEPMPQFGKLFSLGLPATDDR